MNPNKALWEKGDFTEIAAERVENGGGQEEKEMKHGVKGIEMVIGIQVVPQLGTAEISRGGTPAAGRDAVMRNFILQQGFEDPAPAVCPLQYSALVFQPKIVLIGVVAGILFQSRAVFAALCALLWWSALFPKLNPFSALYNRTIGRRPGGFALALPRRRGGARKRKPEPSRLPAQC